MAMPVAGSVQLDEALSPQEQYVRALQGVLAQVDALDEAAAKRILTLLAEARQSLMDALSQIPTDSYLASFYPRLRAEIEQAIRRYGQRYGAFVDGLAREVWDLGIAAVDEPLARAGVSLMVQLPALEPRLLDILANFRADLITGVEQAAVGAVTREIDLGILGKPFADVQQAIADILRTQPDPQGAFASIAARAETIRRTETNRVFNLATQSRQAQLQQRVADVFPEVTLRKRWLHANDDRVRTAHRRPALLEQRPAIDEDFLVVDDAGQVWPASGPHDARLPASLSVKCRCRSVISVDSLMTVLEPT
jgi:hypothetical protein